MNRISAIGCAAASYCAGLAVGTLLTLPMMGNAAVIVPVVGGIFGLPFLVCSVLVIIFWFDAMQREPVLWGLGYLLAMTSAWLCFDFVVLFSSRGGLLFFLSDFVVQQRLALMLACVLPGMLTFYFACLRRRGSPRPSNPLSNGSDG